MSLKTPLTASLLKTTAPYIEALHALDIRTVGDLLSYLPRTHEDLSQMTLLAQAPLEEKITVQGTVADLELVRTRHGKRFVRGTFSDSDGDLAEVLWFNQPHVMRMLKDGDLVVLTGKLTTNGRKLQLLSPQFESAKRSLVHTGRLVPVYPQHDRITTKWLREKMILLQPFVAEFSDPLPEDIRAAEGLVSYADAVAGMHFPQNGNDVQRASERLAFDRMYALQLSALERKRNWQGKRQPTLAMPMQPELVRAFFASLGFTPTQSQRIAIYEILRDMEKDVPMSRLLEGDVGSGKTLVAVTVLLHTVASGGQCALLVPTEVLAEQHVRSIGALLARFSAYSSDPKSGIPTLAMPSVRLLTGSTPAGEGREISQGLASGTVDIIIGTHALLEERVQFRKLQLVIIDEQHRFGVLQRQQLIEKGSPHFLSMTATPIPRTLALTAFGDHDLSVLLEKPGQRKTIRTTVVAPADRRTVERFTDTQIGEGRQAFVICPLISENEDLGEVRNVEAETERLEQEFSGRRVRSLHGRMSSEEKQRIMQAFRAGEFDILVSTSVIEVGIDIPNATIIWIEGAERFGLSQLHQLRGRVGRSDHQSYCFLFATDAEAAGSPRLQAMAQYDSGFQLAEVDLQLRGPGELYGLRQSGLPDLEASDLLNPALITKARRAAQRTLGIGSAGEEVRFAI